MQTARTVFGTIEETIGENPPPKSFSLPRETAERQRQLHETQQRSEKQRQLHEAQQREEHLQKK